MNGKADNQILIIEEANLDTTKWKRKYIFDIPVLIFFPFSRTTHLHMISGLIFVLFFILHKENNKNLEG